MNKHNNLAIIIFLFALVGLTITCCTSVSNNSTTLALVEVPPVFEGSYSAGAYRLQPTEVELDTDLTDMPEQLIAYQVITPEVNDQYAKNLANKLGFFNEWPLYGSKRVAYTYTRDNEYLEIGLEGGISFRQDIQISDIPQQLPSDQDCIEIARHWLETNNLYPSNVARVQVGYGLSVASVDSQTGEAGLPVYYSKRVNFIVSVEDYELSSSGANVLVNDKGKVIQASVITTQFQKYGLVHLKTPQFAFDILKRYLTRVTPIAEEVPECMYNINGTRVSIKNLSIQYARTYKTDYLLPIYVFEGDAFREKPEPEKFIGKVDAVVHQKS